ncbi:BglG family transcription antiterminator [Butyrivibrio sp. MB2005]|uniref:BglG family transcription antiterminator n=1 Tax=Butyrivibrio sp. MB2005 TaxID=1280678 RepID=UPI000427D21C|nr:BglG family transcription antiterminator [Butyrivibrio sp. MB2005]
MELTPRIRQILIYLLGAEQPATDQEVADALGVSKRTILREADYIGSIVKDHGLTLVRKKGEGSQIEGDPEAKQQLMGILKARKEQVVSDKEQRRKLLKLELLRNREPQKLFYYSNMFGVSEATISTDLEAIDEWARECKLEIIRKPGYGITLSGSEKSYRMAMQRFVTENMKTKEITSAGDNIYLLMNEEILSEVESVLEKVEEPYLHLLTNDAYIGLLVHLAVAVERILQGELVSEDSYDARFDKGYDIAKNIATALEKEFSIEIPESEVNNILLHINGAKLNYTSDVIGESGINTDELMVIIEGMIDVFDPGLARELRYDDDFIRGLMVHLEPTLYRIKNEMTISNPLLSQIKQEYPDIYSRCEKAARVITQKTSLVPNDAEIGYLAMHFGAARERIDSRRRKKRTVTIGVICASGFGVAQLMMAKLKSQFSDWDIVLKAYGVDEITQHTVSRTDFFISSINVDELGVDYCLVNPLITNRDVLQISVKIDEYASMPARQENNDFTRQLDEINNIITRVKGVIRRYHHLTVQTDISLESMIRQIAADITDSPRAAAVLAADILAREQVMSQLFPEIGIALFHCRSKAVKDCQIITVGPKEEEPFADEKLQGIRAALCMTMPLDDHRQQNSEMLGRVSSAIIEDEEFLRILQKSDEEGIKEKLQEILRGYFSEQLGDL